MLSTLQHTVCWQAVSLTFLFGACNMLFTSLTAEDYNQLALVNAARHGPAAESVCNESVTQALDLLAAADFFLNRQRQLPSSPVDPAHLPTAPERIGHLTLHPRTIVQLTKAAEVDTAALQRLKERFTESTRSVSTQFKAAVLLYRHQQRLGPATGRTDCNSDLPSLSPPILRQSSASAQL